MKNSANNAPKKSKILKTFKWLFSLIVLLLIIIAAGVYCIINYFDWQSKVRELVHKYGSEVVGTAVNIGNINISLENGNGSVSNITVANPKDYSQKYVIKLGTVGVKVDKESVIKLIKETAQKKGSKTKTVVIDEIRVSNPEVTYELLNLNRNNADDILNNINKNTSSAAAKSAPKAKDENATEYKVAIKKVVVEKGVATVGASLLGVSQTLSLNLPTITINNLGSENQGITIEDGLARVFKEILKTTVNVVSKADLSGLLSGVGDIASGAANVAKDAVNATADTAGKAVNGTLDAAGSVAGSAADGVKNIGSGIGGLFK